MAFDMSALLNKVKDFKAKEDSESGYPKTSFIPEGNHKGRFLVDPMGELFTEYYSYGYFNKGIRDPRSFSPSDFPEGFKDDLSTVVDKLKAYHWKYKAKKTFLTWFWLEDTDSPEKDRWVPKNLYCLIGSNKFSSSFLNFIESMAKDAPNELQSSIDPSQAGVQIQMQVTSGNQGQVQIAVGFPNKILPAIDFKNQVFCSLEDAYIRPGFNLEKYNAILQSYSEELDTFISTGAKTLAEKEAEKKAKEGKEPEIPDQGNQDIQSPPAMATGSQDIQSPPVAQSQPADTAPWAKFKR